MATIKGRAVTVTAPKAALELIEREWEDPGSGEVRVKVQACGICHSDSFTKEGLFPGLSYPRIPGHEIAGTIESIGPGVRSWQVGQRVGIGWLGHYCGYCGACRQGKFVLCENQRVTGIHRDGGYADYVLASARGLAAIPSEIDSGNAAPLMCAGITTFNALRNSGARIGDTVAVLGLGGLGHLGVQFAAKAGFRTVALARGAAKRSLALSLGAHHYIDTAASDPSETLQNLGGAAVILSTVTDAEAIASVLGGLAPDGRLVVLGAAPGPFALSAMALIGKRQAIAGWPSGSARDSEDTLNFSVLTGVRPMIEVFPLERAAEAYDLMMAGKPRFRAVLAISSDQ